MGIIRQLPASVINQIAAGEVVERPASVVKELLENAIDSGATRIDLAVERGGKDLVRVTDNGKGIDPEDLPIAFLPHATSKLIEAEDLFRVQTLGFRGEALAAIAEVSKVRCQSRTPNSETAFEIQVDAGVPSAVEACSGAPGTVIEVRHLFHNTPVRRTFLKADSTEAGHVADMFARIALAHPTIHMTYRSSGKVIHDLPPVTGSRERVGVFFGQETADSLLWVESQVERIHLWGYVGHPSQSRSGPKGQYLFVSGRYVRDRSLSHALSEAYRGLLMTGRSPLAFLHLDLPPEEVDVNVHPMKIEVRFRDGHRIYSQLLATIRQTFLASDLHSRLQTPLDQQSPQLPVAEFKPFPQVVDSYSLKAPAEPDRRSVAEWFQPSHPSGSSSGGFARPGDDWAKSLPARDLAQPHFDEFAGSLPDNSFTASEGLIAASSYIRPTTSPEPRSADSAVSPAKAIQVHDSYLVVETEDGLVVIDQHALHERILYEEFKSRAERGAVESQRLLVPEPVHLSASEAASILERREGLARLGLEVEAFGGDTVLITGTPAMLGAIPPERLLRDLAEHFRSKPLPPSRDALLEDVLNMMACKAAVKAGQRLAPAEIDALLSRRHLAKDAHHCPHGRPTALVFTTTELERQFGRI